MRDYENANVPPALLAAASLPTCSSTGSAFSVNFSADFETSLGLFVSSTPATLPSMSVLDQIDLG